jgi:putative endonuclease
LSAPLGGSGEKRRRAFRRGRKGELLAMLMLCLKGYRILARDFRVPMGEVDIVARQRRTLAFVEVKSRDSLADGIFSVTPRQQRRIARAAAAFVGRHPRYRHHVQRFDIIAVAPWRWPRHIVSAWFGR